MKNSIKRAQSRAGSSFAERENFRPKVRQLKKTLLTLVALIAVTTGAWADETPLLTIDSKQYASFESGSMTFDDKVTVTFSNSVQNDGDDWEWYAKSPASLLTVAGTNGYTITSCKFYVQYDGPAETGYTVEGESPSVYLSGKNVYTDASESVYIGTKGITKIEVYGAAAASDYAFTVAPSEHGTGTVKFFIGSKEVSGAYKADEGKTVTVTITPDEGWIVDEANVKAETYTTWANASARRKTALANIQILGDVTLTKSATAENTWTFTMPAASVLVSAAYLKISTLAFDPADKTNLMEVKKDEQVVTPTEGKLTEVLEGTAINLKANQGYKLKKVEVKKKEGTTQQEL